ncbi:glycosyltransferase [Planctomycetota bacterium]|nr:glycosyltransferase [Planctomycetota bacterium]
MANHSSPHRNDRQSRGVTTVVICYNQVETIAQALTSVASQEIDFEHRIIIGDDGSTDGTREVCSSFAQRVGGSVTLLPLEANLGVGLNLVRVLMRVETPFVAICEGDDFWTDPKKLQRQCDALAAKPEASLCFTDNVDRFETSGEENTLQWSRMGIPEEFGLPFLLRRDWFIRTPTMVWRSEVHDLLPSYYHELYSTDYFLQITAARHGKIIRIDGPPSAVYRHGAGVSRAGMLKQTWRDVHYLHRLPGIVVHNFSTELLRAATVHAARHLGSAFRHALRSIWERNNG